MNELIDIEAFAGPGGEPDECWGPLGYSNGNGYRYLKVAGVKVYVHRLAYEAFVSLLLPGQFVDHLCRNRACWNPSHLEAVTNEENILRGESPPARNARKGVCPRCGTAYSRDGKYRRCRPCRQQTRKDTQRTGVGRAGDRTHCPYGHAYDEANTIIRRRPDGSVKQRQCRCCRVEQQRVRRAARKAEAA